MSETEKVSARLWGMLAALMVVVFTGTYETIMVFMALPTLYKVFDDPVAVTWLITSYLLAGAGFTLISSRLGDLLGRTQMLMVVLGFMAVGSAISATAQDLWLIIAGRAMQGVAASILPLCMGTVRALFPASKVPFGIGMLTATGSVAGGLGMIFAAVLVDQIHWRAIFVASGVMSALCIALVFVVFPRSPMQRDAMKGLDVWGAVLFAPAMVGLTYAISTSAKNGLLSPITLGLAGSSLALLAIWVRHELRHPDPLIQVRLLANREIALCNLTMAFAGISVFQLSQFITVLAQQPTWTGVGLGLTATAAGFLRLPNSLAASVGGAMTGPLSTRFNSRIASLIGAVLMTIGFMLLIPFHTSIPQILMCIVVIGSGVTLNYSATAATIVQVAPGGRASEAAGMMSVVRGTCIAIGSQLIVLSLNIDTVQEVAGGPKYGTGEAFQFTFIWITICSLCCVLLTLALLRPPKVKPVAASALPVEAGE